MGTCMSFEIFCAAPEGNSSVDVPQEGQTYDAMLFSRPRTGMSSALQKVIDLRTSISEMF